MTEPLSRDQLISALDKGMKPRDQWRIGAEHEKFAFRRSDLSRPGYDGPDGIRAMLDGLTRFGWTPVEEGGHVIALERANTEGMTASVSLEPGGQFELSGAPLKDVHDICDETGRHLVEVKTVADELGLGFLGFLSARANVWTDTDPDRTGMLDFVFADGFGFETYVDYALDTPMYFVKRDGRYIDASGQSFRDFMEGRLPALPGEYPTAKDWADHLTTLFPEVRLKSYLEMRGADGGPWSRICALQGLWAGLLYDGPCLSAAWDVVKDWDITDHERLRRDVTRLGLKAEVAGRPLRDIAREVVAIAKMGLKNRARFSGGMVDERGYLSELEDIADSGVTPAERLLDLYHGDWQGDISRVYRDFAY